MGTDRRPRPPREWLLGIYENGTAQDIAKAREVSPTVVFRWLHLYGIPRHTPSESMHAKMDRRSYEERLRNSAASRAIITGKKRSHKDLCKRARGKQRTAKLSEYECKLLAELKRLGFDPIPLLAVDKYNLDFGFPSEKIGIEVDGGNWHKTAKRKMAQDTKKAMLLARLGWKVIRVNTRRANWLPLALPSILAILPPRSPALR